MRTMKKITSIILTFCMIVSVVCVGGTAANADSSLEYAQSTINGSAILHCFNWSYNNIKNNLKAIHDAGYTAVQTSPVQQPKDYDSSYTDESGQWWKLYQPLGLRIAPDNNGSATSWLGTKSELTSLCAEAETYGIKVIVDIVSNHVANDGEEKGTFQHINDAVDTNLKNALYYHSNSKRTNDNNRYNMTQLHLGMPDLNTANTTIQNMVLALLEECVDCGVDGFRFDTAKHIELPTDDSSCKSNYWPTIIDGIKNYCEDNSKPEPFIYGEILGYAGTPMSNYHTYMSVTDSAASRNALNGVLQNNAQTLASPDYQNGNTPDKSVLWAESHDTYSNDDNNNTSGYSDEQMIKTWAIVGARESSASLFFARPNATMGFASDNTTWKSTTVSAVNKFKNLFEGKSEYLSSEGNTAYIERGTKGVVICNLDGEGNVSLTANRMVEGTNYKDQITGNSFTVADGKITGHVGSSGVAVVYEAGNIDDDPNYDSIPSTLYLDPSHNDWTENGARYAIYLFNDEQDINTWTWVDMTENGEYYKADIPSGNWKKVIFCRMNGSNQENNWDNKWNQTVDLDLHGTLDLYRINGKDNDKYTCTALNYANQHTHNYANAVPVWVWADDHSSAYAKFKCNNCSHYNYNQATVTSSEDDDNTIYTATVTFNNITYTDTKTIAKPINIGDTVYLNAGVMTGSQYAAYFFDASANHSWAKMTKDGDVYKATIPEGNWTSVIFCSVNSDFSENNDPANWSDTTAQTVDISLEKNNNYYKITSSTVSQVGTRYTGTWQGTYTAPDHTHVFSSEPTFSWDGSSATATGTCSECNETVTVDALITNMTRSGNTETYTATVGDYENTKTYTALYLSFGNAAWWANDSARFAAYFFNGTGGNTWADMSKVSDNMYKVFVPEGNWTNVIFCRMNGSTTENKWDNKWNQTADLALNSDLTFTLSGNEDDEHKCLGDWSTPDLNTEFSKSFTASSSSDSNVYSFFETTSKTYGSNELLGVQKKGMESETNDVRFITVVNSNILSSDDVEDYGYIFTRTSKSSEAARNNITKLTVDNATHKYSCKNTINTFTGNFGSFGASTDYKYVTAAVKDLPADATIGARFYIKFKDSSNRPTTYATYKTTATGCAFKYSELEE